jgi:hypothetical protein
MAEVKFFIRDKDKQKSAIRAVVSFFGKQYPVSVGISVRTTFWNAKKYRCRADRDYPDAKHVNERIDEWQSILESVAKDFEKKIASPDIHEFKKAVEYALRVRNGQISGKTTYLLEFAEKYKDTCSKSKQTKKNYHSAIKQLSGYEKKYRTKLKFDHITPEFYNSLRNYLLQNTYEIKGETRHYAKNTIGSVIKNLSVFFREAKRAGYHDLNIEGFKVEHEDVDNIYLTVDELIKIHSMQITEQLILEKLGNTMKCRRDLKQKIESLSDNKDRFLIGAFTAMRFGDYSGLDNLKSTDKTISKRTKKTGVKVIIPMHWVIREILERRGNKLPAPISNNKLNYALKELGQLADLTDDVELTVTRGGSQVTARYKKYELLSTHTARRSGCTNMYLAGIDIYTVMGFSGHTTEKSFRKYIKINQEENAKRFIDHPFFNKNKISTC